MGATTAGVRHTALIALLVAIAAGCGNDSNAGNTPSAENQIEETAGATTLPPCTTTRRAVAFEIVGALMAEDEGFNAWVSDSALVPRARPGAADLTNKYAAKGYEVIYFTLAPNNLPIGDILITDALNQWLDQGGFARGPRTRLFAPDPHHAGREDLPAIGISDELVRERSQGVVVEYAYGNSEDKILAFQTGGVAPENVFSLGEAAGTAGSAAVAGDDLVAHGATVDALPKVCE